MSSQVRLARAVILILAVGQAVSGILALADIPAAAQLPAITGVDVCRAATDAGGNAPVSAAPGLCRLALQHPYAVLLILLALAAFMTFLYAKTPRHPRATIFSALLVTIGETAAWVAAFGWSMSAIPRAVLIILLLRGAVLSLEE